MVSKLDRLKEEYEKLQTSMRLFKMSKNSQLPATYEAGESFLEDRMQTVSREIGRVSRTAGIPEPGSNS